MSVKTVRLRCHVFLSVNRYSDRNGHFHRTQRRRRIVPEGKFTSSQRAVAGLTARGHSHRGHVDGRRRRGTVLYNPAYTIVFVSPKNSIIIIYYVKSYSKYNIQKLKNTHIKLKIKNDSTQHMTVYSSVLTLTTFRHH